MRQGYAWVKNNPHAKRQPVGEGQPSGWLFLGAKQSRTAAMTLGCWMTAMRCMRLSQRGQAMTSMANTRRSSVAQGTRRRRMVK
jgi:hypothetical protein